MEQLKELAEVVPFIYTTPEVKNEGNSNYKLVFCTNTDFLLKMASYLKVNRSCLKEFQGHLCVKLYENKYSGLDEPQFGNKEQMKLKEIVQVLNEKHLLAENGD